MNRWKLTDEIRNNITPMVKNYLTRMETLTADECDNAKYEDVILDLSDKGINPYQLKTLLKELGYEDTDFDKNGWEMDFWIDMSRTDGKHFESGCETLVIAGCGMTFELRIMIKDFC